MRSGLDHEKLEAKIRHELDSIKDPCSLASGVPLGLDEMGLIDQVIISDEGAVVLRLRLTSPFCHMIGFFKTEATRLIAALPGVASVTLEADNGLDWSPSMISPVGQSRREAHLQRMREAGTAGLAMLTS